LSELLLQKCVELCQRPFLHLLIGSCGFCPWFYLSAVLHLQISVCWTILASLEWNWLCHGVWSFLCVIEFCLPVFCWGSLHLYSLKILVCNSFLLHIFGYWNECNAGFIEWVCYCSFPFYFLKKFEEFFFKDLAKFSFESIKC
jgi:hypothetical protein